MAALGFYVLPHRRSKVKAQLRDRVNRLREQLSAAITHRFETELRDSGQRLREGIAPYTRFVRVEREKLDRLSAELQAAQGRARAIRAEADKDL
jgi:chaperonin cofactor prefoldin